MQQSSASGPSRNQRDEKEGGEEEEEEEEEERKRPSRLKRVIDKAGLDAITIVLMLKAAMPPTIALAAYQADAWATQYTAWGYFVAIVSGLAKFLQTIFFSILSVCIAACIALLAIYCSVRARINTTPSGAPPMLYNSSASTICGIWLFFQIYVISAVRSARPQLQLPALIYTIFAVNSMSDGSTFLTMSQGISYVEGQITAFMTGFALATGVSLIIVPITSRRVVFQEMADYLGALGGVVKAEIAYTASLEHTNVFRGEEQVGKESKTKPTEDNTRSASHSTSPGATDTSAAKAVQQALAQLKGLHGKLAADLTFAKRETAYGKLGPNEMDTLFRHLENIFLPLLGWTSSIDIFKRIADLKGWSKPLDGEVMSEEEREAVEEWQGIMKILHGPFAEIGEAIGYALRHVSLRLEFQKRPQTTAGLDEESTADRPSPDSDRFKAWYERKTDEFYSKRESALREWCEEKGIPLPKDSFNTKVQFFRDIGNISETQVIRDRTELYLVLHMEYLLYAAARSALNLIAFVDSKLADGTLSKSRLIVPGYATLENWLASIIHDEDICNDHLYAVAADDREEVDMEKAFRTRKDPEHLPPRNAFERLGNVLRKIPHTLASKHSVFGFRVACATMSIAILAFLNATAQFFVQQRLLWSVFAITLYMSRNTGASTFGFILRIGGTFVAMVASYVIWYIVDGHTAGVLVFTFIWIAICFYVVIKLPKYLALSMLSATTVVIIIGEELQVQKIGVRIATSNGQPYYPVYELAPYRLACLAGGIAVAFFWTFFPYPVTEHSEVRRDLGATLYLMANFYAVVHETVGANVREDDVDSTKDDNPGAKLEKIRQKIFSKQLLLLNRMKENSAYMRWEISVGGRFPKELYDRMIAGAENILNDAALISYASWALKKGADGHETEWQRDFRKLYQQVQLTSWSVTARLCLLASSVSSGTPLPPHLKRLQPFQLTKTLAEIDRDILCARHIAEPGYAAFAVIQIASGSIVHDLNSLMDLIKDLVGELDSSFYIK